MKKIYREQEEEKEVFRKRKGYNKEEVDVLDKIVIKKDVKLRANRSLRNIKERRKYKIITFSFYFIFCLLLGIYVFLGYDGYIKKIKNKESLEVEKVAVNIKAEKTKSLEAKRIVSYLDLEKKFLSKKNITENIDEALLNEGIIYLTEEEKNISYEETYKIGVNDLDLIVEISYIGSLSNNLNIPIDKYDQILNNIKKFISIDETLENIKIDESKQISADILEYNNEKLYKVVDSLNEFEGDNDLKFIYLTDSEESNK